MQELEYEVRVKELDGGDYRLVFDTRKKARAYKKSLIESKSQLEAYILRREYLDGFIASEDEIS